MLATCSRYVRTALPSFNRTILRAYSADKAELTPELRKWIDEAVKKDDVVVFMKGTHEQPMCGFSRNVKLVLDYHEVPFKDYNVLENEELRDGIKLYSEWPTIPQVYVKSQFVGGSDILVQMHKEGEITDFFDQNGMATANVELPAVNSIGSWAEAVEEDSQPIRKRTEVTKDGIRTVTDYIKDEQTGAVNEVITSFKVITKRVPKTVAERKKWKKFGQSTNDGPGPQLYTTYVDEEVQIQFTRNREQEQAHADVPLPGLEKTVGTKAHCRICKANDHWSVNCPFKEIMMQNADEEDNVRGAPAKDGRYIPPTQRDGRVIGSSERRDDFTVRVTNLPEDDDNIEEDLRHAFSRAGRIDRLYVARDKQTLRIKGFAFVTYTCRDDAERAIEMFRGFKMGHLILKVEWTKPRLDASGKTTFMKKINGEDVSTISPTFGFNIETLIYKGWKLNMWDVGGQQSLRSYWRNYFERTDGLIWVVDPWDTARLEDCRKELFSLLNEEVLVGCSVLILINKCDRGEVEEEAVKKALQLEKISGHHFETFKTSAYTGENLLPALDWLCKDIASKVLILD